MASRVIDGNHCLTSGTLDPDGRPRLSPVYYTAAVGGGEAVHLDALAAPVLEDELRWDAASRVYLGAPRGARCTCRGGIQAWAGVDRRMPADPAGIPG